MSYQVLKPKFNCSIHAHFSSSITNYNKIYSAKWQKISMKILKSIPKIFIMKLQLKIIHKVTILIPQLMMFNFIKLRIKMN